MLFFPEGGVVWNLPYYMLHFVMSIKGGIFSLRVRIITTRMQYLFPLQSALTASDSLTKIDQGASQCESHNI